MRARLIVCVAAGILGLTALQAARDGARFTFAGESWYGPFTLLAAGWALTIAGVSILARRRSRIAGLLLISAGCVWLLGEWDNPAVGSASMFTIGLLVSGGCAPLIAWAVLAYATGRLRSRIEWTAVVSGCVIGAVLLGLAPTLVTDPARAGCTSCPRNLFSVADDPDLFLRINRAGLRLVWLWAVAAVGVIAWRLAVASATSRRRMTPVALTGAAYLIIVGWSFRSAVQRGFPGTGDADRRFWYAQAGALVALSAAVLCDSLRVRRRRSMVGALMTGLDESNTGGLSGVLADALDDQSLAIVYPVGDGRYVGSDGSFVADIAESGRDATALGRGGEVVAVLLHRRGLLEDSDTVDEVIGTVRLALENERLGAEIRVRELDLLASRARIVDASITERRRLERDLHDGAQQRLVVLLAGVRLALTKLAIDPPVDSLLRRAIAELERALRELRDIAHGIHPVVLTDEGLVAALEALAEELNLVLSIDGLPDDRYGRSVEHAAYHVVAEAARAGATRVAAARQGSALCIELAAPGVLNLVDLEDQVGALDGSVHVADGSGGDVTLRIEIPCG